MLWAGWEKVGSFDSGSESMTSSLMEELSPTIASG